MSNKGNALISLIVLALGVVFIWLCNRADFLHSVVMLCGVAFVLPAVISLLSMFLVSKDNRRSAGARMIQMICGVGGLGLGACILLMPDTFRPLLVYLFAALLIVGGALQIFLVSHKSRQVAYPGWLLVAPILVLVAGVVMVSFESFRHMEYEKWVVLITGCAFVAYGLNGIIISIIHYNGMRAINKRAAMPAAPVQPEAAKVVEPTNMSDTVVAEPVSTVGADRLDSEPSADVERD